MAAITCKVCGGETLYEGAKPKFCAHCAAPFPAEAEARTEAVRLAEEARDTEDTAQRHELLMKARERFPNCFEIEREILYLGRLYERGGKPDFYRIPYWPLNALYQPELYSEKQRREMLDSFFENPQLKSTMALSENPEAFFDEFLFHMARAFVHMFFEGASANSMFFGFRRRGSEIVKRCAYACAIMLINIENAPIIDDTLRPRLLSALWRGFIKNFADQPAEALLLEAVGTRLRYRP